MVMEYKDIKKIIELMKQNELTEFELQEDAFRIAIKRGHAYTGPMPVMAQMPAGYPMPSAPAAAAPAAAGGDEEDHGNYETIKSPIVGTFYRSSSPDSDPFVTVGQEVDEDTTVCIVEAMKVMNEIKAEVRGVVRKILVENAMPVEFGQPLYLVEPL